MISAIFENLFKPNEPEDVVARRLPLFKQMAEFDGMFDDALPDYYEGEALAATFFKKYGSDVDWGDFSLYLQDAAEEIFDETELDLFKAYTEWKESKKLKKTKKKTNEDLFKPATDDEIDERNVEFYKLIDQFAEKADEIIQRESNQMLLLRDIRDLCDVFENRHEDDVWWWTEIFQLLFPSQKVGRIWREVGDSARSEIRQYKRWKMKTNENLFKPNDPDEVENRARGGRFYRLISGRVSRMKVHAEGFDNAGIEYGFYVDGFKRHVDIWSLADDETARLFVKGDDYHNAADMVGIPKEEQKKIFEELFKPVSDDELSDRQKGMKKGMLDKAESVLTAHRMGVLDAYHSIISEFVWAVADMIKAGMFEEGEYHAIRTETLSAHDDSLVAVDFAQKMIDRFSDKVNEDRSDIHKRLGLCYELAGRYANTHKDVDLIHGSITNRLGDGKTIDHAWIEKGDHVFDPVIDEWFDEAVYEALYGTKEKIRFNTEGVLINILKYKHWGPWDGSEPPNPDFNIEDD